MDRLERELSQALKRKEPPADFAARLAARVAAQEGRSVNAVTRRPKVFALPRWLPAAAAVLLLAGTGGLAWRRHQGMVAKDQVMLAMRITAGKLNQVQAHMREARQ